MGPKISETPHIAILMATMNGARYLEEQLASIQAQSHSNWSLWVSDDGSTDETVEIIDKFKRSFPNKPITRLKGPCKGAAQNFLSLLANPSIKADYYAFCDQDDVWFPSKLKRALTSAVKSSDMLFLYGARTAVTNHALKEKCASSLKVRPLGFRNALVENYAGGNTMVFNDLARKLACQTKLDFDVFAHDWFLYILVSGAGGNIVYDNEPCLYYRQHGANQIGYNSGLRAKFVRILKIWNGRYRNWNSQNQHALEGYISKLTKENQEVLGNFASARKQSGFNAIKSLRAGGLYRQSKIGTLSLLAAAMIDRI